MMNTDENIGKICIPRIKITKRVQHKFEQYR